MYYQEKGGRGRGREVEFKRVKGEGREWFMGVEGEGGKGRGLKGVEGTN